MRPVADLRALGESLRRLAGEQRGDTVRRDPEIVANELRHHAAQVDILADQLEQDARDRLALENEVRTVRLTRDWNVARLA